MINDVEVERLWWRILQALCVITLFVRWSREKVKVTAEARARDGMSRETLARTEEFSESLERKIRYSSLGTGEGTAYQHSRSLKTIS